ncbi:NACHT domain-containing protein [Actinomadura rayongensis]|uniref:NACHT domain-containing protein n=1 Tax=Actinomadura rayongensis TaxID=1429076 RepID=A0A6I4WK15_9ACTN|nr:NACHT domain-containing protein [Actinomadura rayongensis]MXQ68026.1 NACHT domain-containing protein [Actinomadura rayongensis]
MTQGEYVLRMKQVYVDVALRPRPVQETERDPGVGAAPPGPGRRGPLSSFLDDNRVFAVIGSPGSGKTTLVRHVALALCRPWSWHRRRLPVLLYLRDHADAILSGTDLADLAVSVPWLRGRIPASWLARRLDAGRCLVLLDGLDEVADDADRRRVVTWVRAQIARHPRSTFVVTSRPHGYTSNRIPTADVLQVQRFSPAQISEFLHGWYRAIEHRARQGSARHIAEVADERAADLLGRIREQVALYDLAANPLLLTMIANVHRYRGQLPGSRAALYAEMCDVLLNRRQEDKNLNDRLGLTGPQKTVIVQRLATHMMTQRTRDVSSAEACDAIETPLAEVSGDIPPMTFLREVARTGLVVEREHDRYGFVHLTLQEFLAAAHIRQNPDLLHLLTQNVSKAWWRETALLWAADADASPLVAACLDANTVTALVLALDCAGEARQLRPDLRQRVDRMLSSPSPDDVLPTSIVEGIRLSLELRRVVWLDEHAGTTVSARPISGRVWMVPPRPDLPGIHVFAMGVRAEEVREFVTWVNTTLDDGFVYRLPTPDEIRRIDLSPNLDVCTVWTADETRLLLHCPGDTPWPYLPTPVQVAQFTRRCLAHFEPLLQLLLGARDDDELTDLLTYAYVTGADQGSPLTSRAARALLLIDNAGAAELRDTRDSWFDAATSLLSSCGVSPVYPADPENVVHTLSSLVPSGSTGPDGGLQSLLANARSADPELTAALSDPIPLPGIGMRPAGREHHTSPLPYEHHRRMTLFCRAEKFGTIIGRDYMASIPALTITSRIFIASWLQAHPDRNVPWSTPDPVHSFDHEFQEFLGLALPPAEDPAQILTDLDVRVRASEPGATLIGHALRLARELLSAEHVDPERMVEAAACVFAFALSEPGGPAQNLARQVLYSLVSFTGPPNEQPERNQVVLLVREG